MYNCVRTTRGYYTPVCHSTCDISTIAVMDGVFEVSLVDVEVEEVLEMGRQCFVFDPMPCQVSLLGDLRR